MKKMPLTVVHRLFTAAALLVLGAFLGFLTYLYLVYSGPLIGDVNVTVAPDLLYKLDSRRLQAIMSHLQTRAALPDIPADLPDPFRPPPGG